MKNLLLFSLLLFLFRIPVEAQTIYWTEDFNSSQGWYLQDNWTIAEGKLEFSWTPSVNNFDLSATSPYIILDDNIGEVIFSQFLDVFSASPDEFAEISIITEGGPVILWDYPLTGGSWGSTSGQDLSFSINEYAGQTVKFKFRTYGLTTFNWNAWDVLEIKLTAYYDHDLCISSLSGPTVVQLAENNSWTVEVTNNGSLPESDYTIEILDHKSGNIIGSLTSTEPIAPQQTKFFDIDWTPYAAYNTAFYGIVTHDADEFDGNNSSASHFIRIDPGIPCNILLWDHDNGIQTIVDPEKGDHIKPATGLQRILQDAGYEFDYMTDLPDNLNDYDIVLSTMGCYCLD